MPEIKKTWSDFKRARGVKFYFESHFSFDGLKAAPGPLKPFL